MAVLSEHDLVTRIRQRIEQAITSGNGNQEQRAVAFRQFFMQPTGTEEEGHSSIQSADVNSMITAVSAQMVISFSTDTVVSYEADSAEDEQQAQAESRAVNKIAVEDNGGFKVILGGVQNALMYRNGYLKVWWNDDVSHYFVRHDAVPAEEIPVLTESEQGIERKLVSYDRETGNARVEVTETKKRLRVKTVANERFFIDPDWDEQDLEGCGLAGEIHYKTRDELSRMGVPWEKVKQLKAIGRQEGSEQQSKRRGQQTGGVDPVSFQMDICRVFEAYVRFSYNSDDDRAYLYQCWIAETGDFWLLEPELKARMPYAVGSAFPIANQHLGEALSEKLQFIQDGKTELFRQWIDNVRNCSWGRYAVVSGKGDAADLLRPKAGAPVRVKMGPVGDAVMPLPVQDVGQSIALAMAELDKQRSERGGAATDMLRSEMQVAQDTAYGTERVYASKELLVSYMTRNLAESMISSLYQLAHAELRAGEAGPINLKIAEEWKTVDPTEWRERNWCTVKVGYSMGERMLMSQTLGMAIQGYLALMQMGFEGRLVSLSGLYKMLTDYLTLNLIDNAESYYVDPQSPPALQAAQAQAEGQQQAAQQAQELEDRKNQVEVYKSDQKTSFDYFNAVLTAQVDMEKSEVQGAVDAVAIRSEAQAAQRADGGNAGSGGNGADSGGAAKRGNGRARPAAGKSGKSRPAN